MTDNTIATLRDHLFEHLRTVRDTSKPLDVQRHKAVAETSQILVNLAKVEVDFAGIMKGALDVPFMEGQERPNLPDATKDTRSPEDRLLNGGPAEDHPWRQTVHVLKK